MSQLIRKILKAVRLGRVGSYRRALVMGVGAAIEHQRVLLVLRDLGVADVIDIGANVGQFSLVARRCLPRAGIFAFEPLAAACGRFRSVFRDDPNVQLFNAAVGPESGRREMHVSRLADSSSLLSIGPRQSAIFPGTEESHLEWVRVGWLHEFLDPSRISERSLLKIDVQGYELAALKGCARFMGRFSAVYVECSFCELYDGQALAWEVVDWLRDHEFRLCHIGSVVFDRRGMAVQGDFLFLRHPGELESFDRGRVRG